MKKIIHNLLKVTLIALGVFVGQSNAQTLNNIPSLQKVRPNGYIAENDIDSVAVTLTNNTSLPVVIVKVRLSKIYNSVGFSTLDTNFTIQPTTSYNVKFKFSAIHNIDNRCAAVFTTASGSTFNVNLAAKGAYSIKYYNTSYNLSDQALKNALNARLDSNLPPPASYAGARDQMFMIIDNKKTNGQGAAVNTLECCYTGRLVTNYATRTDAQNAPNNFNTEHTFPQSLFASALPMVSDLNHLFPTDEAANGKRSNFQFGKAIPPFRDVAINAPSLQGNDFIYEPRDFHKGACSRAMLYFAINYPQYCNSGFFPSQEAILRSWHATFKPTTIHRKRNNDIFVFQKNRNPLIDYPQFADRITSFASLNSVALDSFKLVANSAGINLGFPIASSQGYGSVSVTNEGSLSFKIVSAQLKSGININLAPADTGSITPGSGKTYFVTATGSQNAQTDTLIITHTIPNQSVIKIPVFLNNPLAVAEAMKSLGYKAPIVYPNPLTGNDVSIQFFGAQNLSKTVKVYNILGEEQNAESTMLDGNKVMVHVNKIPAGLYLLRISEGSEVKTAKLQIQ